MEKDIIIIIDEEDVLNLESQGITKMKKMRIEDTDIIENIEGSPFEADFGKENIMKEDDDAFQNTFIKTPQKTPKNIPRKGYTFTPESAQKGIFTKESSPIDSEGISPIKIEKNETFIDLTFLN